MSNRIDDTKNAMKSIKHFFDACNKRPQHEVIADYYHCRKQLELIYEAIVGDDGINRYDHEEIIDRIHEYYDCYQYVVDNVYSEGRYIK